MFKRDTIQRSAKTVPDSIILYGHRRMGKSSILRNLERVAPAGSVIVYADMADPALFNASIRQALFLILLACIFDLLDGRVARMGGAESPFGREFDSLADLISFGAAPAFLVQRIVFRDVFVEHGLTLSGLSPDGSLVEIVELQTHPWFIGCQFHPELQSRPTRPHPLFAGFIGAAVEARTQRAGRKRSAPVAAE